MQSVLEELWYGNICPNEGCRKTTPEVKELMGYIADHHEALLGMLTDKQKEILQTIVFEFKDKSSNNGLSDRQQNILSGLIKEFTQKADYTK